jgi:hypothetical protein
LLPSRHTPRLARAICSGIIRVLGLLASDPLRRGCPQVLRRRATVPVRQSRFHVSTHSRPWT